MLRVQLLVRFSSRVVNIHNLSGFPIRRFCSNKESSSFGEVLKKVKNSYDEHGEKVKVDDEKSQESKDSEKINEDTPNKKQDPAVDYAKYATDLLGSGRTLLSSFVTGVKDTWTEMLQGQKESQVRKAVPHAQVYQTKKRQVDEDGEEIPEVVYDGPTAIMVGKTQKSTWEQMSERLENSPLIREMLKNSRKFTKQAASTDVGKQAQKIGEGVKDKIHVNSHMLIGIVSNVLLFVL